VPQLPHPGPTAACRNKSDQQPSVTEYVKRYATEEALLEYEKKNGLGSNGSAAVEESSDSEESTLSEFSENETETMEL